MSLDPITALLDIGKTALDKYLPDPQAKADALFKLEQLHANSDIEELHAQLQLIISQTEINKIEAASPDRFVAGWRPAIGWVCAASLFTYYVPYCLIATSIWAYHCLHTGTLIARPDLGIADLISLVGAMLGIAGMRTAEKLNGKA